MRLSQSIRGGADWLRSCLAAIGAVAFSAITWLFIMAVAGASSLVAGVFVIAGAGWALVAAGALFLFAGLVLLKGMSRG